jgi:hypothetical protein
MCKTIWCLFLFMFSANIKFAETFQQTYVLVSNVEKYDVGGVTSYMDYSGNHQYAGTQNDEPNDNNRFRLVYAFNLSSIPAGSNITSAQLYLQGVNTSTESESNYPFWPIDIKKYEGSFSALAETKWNTITSSALLYSLQIPRSQTSFSGSIDFTSTSDFSTYTKSKFGGFVALQVEKEFRNNNICRQKKGDS